MQLIEPCARMSQAATLLAEKVTEVALPVSVRARVLKLLAFKDPISMVPLTTCVKGAPFAGLSRLFKVMSQLP